jgi:hypothetical protein
LAGADFVEKRFRIVAVLRKQLRPTAFAKMLRLCRLVLTVEAAHNSPFGPLCGNGPGGRWQGACQLKRSVSEKFCAVLESGSTAPDKTSSPAVAAAPKIGSSGASLRSDGRIPEQQVRVVLIIRIEFDAMTVLCHCGRVIGSAPITHLRLCVERRCIARRCAAPAATTSR